MKRNLIYSGIVAAVVSIAVIAIYTSFLQHSKDTVRIEHINQVPGQATLYTADDKGNFVPLDFTEVAAEVVETVVHIRSTQNLAADKNQRQMPSNPFRDFFDDGGQDSPFFRFYSPEGGRQPEVRMGTGSGVIIDQKGYIVTNNHVVDGAEDIEVTLHNNRSYKASVVGADPTTDIALIKIDGDNLPTIKMVNSEHVKVGEWVLAVGNPMGLNSTVTAGIVSATGRNINILREKFAVESFIQTDAAINPGNSGGALVNMQGGLIGINTAIASPTGTYTGYGFAVPSDIVNKVVEDLLTYGAVQRGVLGVMIRNMDSNLARQKNLSILEGVYVDSLLNGSAAAEAGIKKGDVITRVDGKTVKSAPELQGIIAQHRPGDRVSIAVQRKGGEKTFEVVLNNREGSKKLVEIENTRVLNSLGAEFKDVDAALSQKLGIDGGVLVEKLHAGKLRRDTKIKEGFIVTKVDGKKVRNIKDFVKALENKTGGVMLEGTYEHAPGTYYYALGMNS